MSKFAKIVNDTVVEVLDTLEGRIHPALHGAYVQVPNTVEPGMVKNGKKFEPAPEIVPADLPEAVAAPRNISRVDFLRRMTRTERITLRGLTGSDPVVADFLGLLEMVNAVDLDSDDVVEGLGYLEQQGHLGAGRAAEIGA